MLVRLSLSDCQTQNNLKFGFRIHGIMQSNEPLIPPIFVHFSFWCPLFVLFYLNEKLE